MTNIDEVQRGQQFVDHEIKWTPLLILDGAVARPYIEMKEEASIKCQKHPYHLQNNILLRRRRPSTLYDNCKVLLLIYMTLLRR